MADLMGVTPHAVARVLSANHGRPHLHTLTALKYELERQADSEAGEADGIGRGRGVRAREEDRAGRGAGEGGNRGKHGSGREGGAGSRSGGSGTSTEGRKREQEEGGKGRERAGEGRRGVVNRWQAGLLALQGGSVDENQGERWQGGGEGSGQGEGEGRRQGEERVSSQGWGEGVMAEGDGAFSTMAGGRGDVERGLGGEEDEGAPALQSPAVLVLLKPPRELEYCWRELLDLLDIGHADLAALVSTTVRQGQGDGRGKRGREGQLLIVCITVKQAFHLTDTTSQRYTSHSPHLCKAPTAPPDSLDPEPSPKP